MSRIALSKLVLVLALSTLLAAPSTGWAAGRRFSSDGTWVRGFAPENLLVMLWSYLAGRSGKEGCGLDPSGLCKSNPSEQDAGCGLDPSGCESPNSSIKNGCEIDPHGGCAYAGCGIDPHGACIGDH